jgi:hypothetical protein
MILINCNIIVHPLRNSDKVLYHYAIAPHANVTGKLKEDIKSTNDINYYNVQINKRYIYMKYS